MARGPPDENWVPVSIYPEQAPFPRRPRVSGPTEDHERSGMLEMFDETNVDSGYFDIVQSDKTGKVKLLWIQKDEPMYASKTDSMIVEGVEMLKPDQKDFCDKFHPKAAVAMLVWGRNTNGDEKRWVIMEWGVGWERNLQRRRPQCLGDLARALGR